MVRVYVKGGARAKEPRNVVFYSVSLDKARVSDITHCANISKIMFTASLVNRAHTTCRNQGLSTSRYCKALLLRHLLCAANHAPQEAARTARTCWGWRYHFLCTHKQNQKPEIEHIRKHSNRKQLENQNKTTRDHIVNSLITCRGGPGGSGCGGLYS